MSPKELKDQKLSDIYHALITLLNEKPLEKISITELTGLAGVSRTYYYKNFDTIGDVISQFGFLSMIQYIRRLPNQPKLTLSLLMTHYFQLVKNERHSQLTLIDAGMEQVLIKVFNTVFHYLMKKKLFDIPAERRLDPYWDAFLSGAVINMSISWLRQGSIESPAFMGAKIDRFVRA